MITPLFNANDEHWVVPVGRYILNMGALEVATRLIIVRIEGTDRTQIFRDDLTARIGFIRSRFPRGNQARHKWAMNVLDVAVRHAGFRNIVAHAPLMISSKPDGTTHINGLLDVASTNPNVLAQLITLEELKGRVDEAALVAKGVLEMQAEFGGAGSVTLLSP